VVRLDRRGNAFGSNGRLEALMSGAITRTLQVATVFLVLAAVSLAAAPALQKTADESLKERIEFGLETSKVVKKYDIKIKVANGEAILTGDVATEAQKAEAARLAKIAGATKIQNAIVVDPDEDKSVADRIKAGLTKTGEKISDGWITTKVKWFLVSEEMLKGTDIDVDTKDGVVTLKGTVRDAGSRARAVALATDTDGVKRVVDELTISR
jgi:osmotically-inducible protein OsmY